MPTSTATRARKRDAEASRSSILKAARAEFAKKGLAGARVDIIAEKAKVNKRMIYHYFGSKEALFTKIVENTYVGIRQAEQELKLEELSPEDAISKLVRFTFEYYIKNPFFIPIINSANLYKAKHLKDSPVVGQYNQRLVATVESILARGVEAGIFRADVDPVQLNVTIAAINYYYITNRYTGEIIFQRPFMTEEAIEERIRFNTDTILRLIKADT